MEKELASKIWEGQLAQAILEDQFMTVCPGLDDFNFRYDEYDSSIEIDDLPDDFRLNKDSWQMFKEAGFYIIYLNHKNGWETHYNTEKYTDGWRVHYHHELLETENRYIEVEKFPKSWPKEWLKTGYVKTKGKKNDSS